VPDAPPTAASPLDAALRRVGDRWSLLVVGVLLDGPRRFGELLEAVPGLAPNVLSARLKALERDGLVVARAYSQRPPRYAYELTEAGAELSAAVAVLGEWGGRQGDAAEPLRHDECGTPLEARWWCPSCERPVDPDEGEEHVV
jgi:DNA-binding HxlR family transcriptional regulator